MIHALAPRTQLAHPPSVEGPTDLVLTVTAGIAEHAVTHAHSPMQEGHPCRRWRL